MLPSALTKLPEGYTTVVQPTRTYRLTGKNGHVTGTVDGLAAMRQAVEKALLTERFRYPIYGPDYGVETQDLYGQPLSYVCPELERRIGEALVCDARVQGVTDFAFERREKGALHVSFTVHTVFGDLRAEREVTGDV